MELLARSMGYVHGRLENNAASYHDTGCHASSTLQCTLYLQRATRPNGAAMSWPLTDLIGVLAVHCPIHITAPVYS